MILAQIFCERVVRELEGNLSDLAKICRDPKLSRLLEAEATNLNSAQALLQFICADLAISTSTEGLHRGGHHDSSTGIAIPIQQHLDRT